MCAGQGPVGTGRPSPRCDVQPPPTPAGIGHQPPISRVPPDTYCLTPEHAVQGAVFEIEAVAAVPVWPLVDRCGEAVGEFADVGYQLWGFVDSAGEAENRYVDGEFVQGIGTRAE